MQANNIGRYEILDELSRGGMGVVYRARDPLIDRIVAVKVVGMGLSRRESQKFDEHFDREARSAGQLNHPNIVTIHDMGKSDDGAYIAMEFLDGRSLRDILDSGVVLEPARVAQIGVQVAEGLGYAHEHGIVHCDIKPANIMVSERGRVKITDFGIARLPTGSRTFAGTVVGSPRYISPEQILGRRVDARSDIFSLGAVLYEMLTGVPPFGGGELDEILFQVINDKPEPPSARNAAIPAAFDAIVERALAKAPAERYQSASELAADLRALLPPKADVPMPVPDTAAAPVQRRSDATTVLISALDVDVAAERAIASALDVRTIAAARLRKVLVLSVPLVIVVAIAAWAFWDGTERKQARATAAAAPAASFAPAVAGDPTSDPSSQAPMAPLAAVAVETPVSPAPPKSVAAKPQARLTLAVTPWGEIFVDGRKRGVSPPLNELNLVPGRHTIEIRNSTFAPHVETVDVLADANVRIKYKFE